MSGGDSERGVQVSPYSARTERMAWRLVESLRRHAPELPVQVYAQDYLPVMPWRRLPRLAVKVTRGCHSGNGPLRWLNKLEAAGNSCFGETLFLDCDGLVQGSVEGWFETLGTDDLTYWHFLRRPEEVPDQLELNALNPHRFCPHYGVEGVPATTGGGHYFIRRSGRSARLLRTIAGIMLEAVENRSSLYWKLAGEGNLVGDEPAASMVMIEEGVRLPAESDLHNPPVGCFMAPWQQWAEPDLAKGLIRYHCQRAGQILTPVATHFAGGGKDDPLYRDWVESAGC